MSAGLKSCATYSGRRHIPYVGQTSVLPSQRYFGAGTFPENIHCARGDAHLAAAPR